MPRRSESGFTLLEIMIAVSIMTVAFAAILTSQSGAISQTLKVKELNVGGWLAQKSMVEWEHKLEGKPFKELDKVKSGRFEAPYGNYAWKIEVREIKFPDLNQPAKEGEGIPEAVRIMVKVITKYLGNAIRELVVTVTWPHSGAESRVQLTTYLIDLDAEFNFAI